MPLSWEVAFFYLPFGEGSKALFPRRRTSGLLAYNVGGTPLASFGKPWVKGTDRRSFAEVLGKAGLTQRGTSHRWCQRS